MNNYHYFFDSQNYIGNNTNYMMYGQNYAAPGQNYAAPGQNYAAPSQNFIGAVQNNDPNNFHLTSISSSSISSMDHSARSFYQNPIIPNYSDRNLINKLDTLDLSNLASNPSIFTNIYADNFYNNNTHQSMSGDVENIDKTKCINLDNESESLNSDYESIYDYKDSNIEEYTQYKMIKEICSIDIKNYLKKQQTHRFDTVSSSMMVSLFSTNLDVLTDLYLKVYFNNLNTYESNLYLTLHVENSRIFNIPYTFLKQWLIYENRNEYEYSEYIRVPMEIICGDIHLYILNKNYQKKVSVEINYIKYESYPSNINEFVTYGECVFVGKYINTKKKVHRSDESEKYPMQFFQNMYIKECSNYEVSLPCKFKNFTKGFVIIGEEVSEISNILVKINNTTVMHVEKEKINLFCERLTSRMLYVPMDSKYKLKNVSTDSYNSVIYFSDNYEVSIEIECPPQNSLVLIALTLTYYQIKNGKIIVDNNLLESNKIYKYHLEKGFFHGNKIVDSHKSFCVISQENIKYGENYTECPTCKNSFINKHIHTYFDMNGCRQCPYCRNDWDTYKFYCNKNDDSTVTRIIPFENVSYLEEYII